MSQRTITSLSMSQTKDELLRHLGMSPEIYELMANETSLAYDRLTKDHNNFKANSDHAPPYDWSDITELAKQSAAFRLSQSSDPRTSPYWQMGASASNDNNWVAVWFLYHKFRYRDGRNRAKGSDKKGVKKHQKSASDDKKSSCKSSSSRSSYSSSNSSPAARLSEIVAQSAYYEPAIVPITYTPTPYPTTRYIPQPVEPNTHSSPTVATSRPFFDPVKNEYLPRPSRPY